MAITIQLPDRDQVFASVLQEFKDRLPEANLTEGEPYWVLAQIMATTCWSVFQPVAYVADQIFPTSASTEFLIRHGNARRIYRKTAGYATGLVLILGPHSGAVQMSGSVTDSAQNNFTISTSKPLAFPLWDTIPVTVLAYDSTYNNRFIVSSITNMVIGDSFILDGNKYCIKSIPGGNTVIIYGVIIGDPTGKKLNIIASAIVSITADIQGSAGNLQSGAQVNIGTPNAGIDPIALILEMGSGTDIEAEDKWAERIEEVAAEYPAGGNRSQLLGWAKGLATKQERDDNLQKDYAIGVDRAWVYPLFRNLGTADIVVQGIKGARHLSSQTLSQIQNYINPSIATNDNPGQVAMGADIKITDFTELSISLNITIFGGSGFPPDYKYSPIVAATSTVTRINTTSNPLPFIAPGNRVCFFSGNPFWYTVGTVASVDAVGLTMSAPLNTPPLAGTSIYPGSALIAPVRDVLLSMFDNLTPGDTIPPTRYPAPTTDNPDQLNLTMIDKMVMSVSGIRDLIITLPTTNIIPAGKQQVILNVLTIIHLP